MDIIDIMLAKALTPEGQADNAAKAAQSAAQTAASAVQEATAAAQQASAAAEALENVDEDILSMIKQTALVANTVTTNDTVLKNVSLQYPDNTTSGLTNFIKLYKSTGTNIDGSMTQQAITQALSNLQQLIGQNNGGSGEGGGYALQFDPADAGRMVVIDEQGHLVTSQLDEATLLALLATSDQNYYDDVVGVEIDYVNKTCDPLYAAQGLQPEDFKQFTMYGGRQLCNVSDGGQILNFEGEINFDANGGNGQVMVYCPKFYYKRIPLDTEEIETGTVIRKEQLLLSDTYKPGFKTHPLFINSDGNTVDYVLVSAFEGCCYDVSASSYLTHDEGTIDFSEDKLSSIANAKPMSGQNNSSFTINTAETLAQNRGQRWHITNLQYESMMQMLGIVQYCTLNLPSKVGLGVINLPVNYEQNASSLTGSTLNLNTMSGKASVTINENNGSYTNQTENGKTAVRLNKIENPWGNLWHYIGGLKIVGNGSQYGGVPYICSNYDYEENNYNGLSFKIANGKISGSTNVGWISGFGYDKTFDWVFLPIECSSTANSALPVGDTFWAANNLNGICRCSCGGTWCYGDQAGPFNYGLSENISENGNRVHGCRIMYIPILNEQYYSQNKISWNSFTNS